MTLDDDHVEPLFLVSGGDLLMMGQLIEEWCTVTSSAINASKCALLVWERDCQDPIVSFQTRGAMFEKSAQRQIAWSPMEQSRPKIARCYSYLRSYRRVARLARF